MPWTADDEEINGVIDSNMKSSPPNPPAINTAETVRNLFKAYWSVVRGQVQSAIEYVDLTNSSAFIQDSLAEVEALKNQTIQSSQAASNASDESASLLFQTQVAKDLAEMAANNANLELLPKGAWNIILNSPSLGEIPPVEWLDGSYVDISPNSGFTTFSGANFPAGQQLNPGDRLKKIGSQWYYIKASDLALQKIVELLSSIQDNYNFDDGFKVIDSIGNVGLELDLAGMLKVYSILSTNINALKVNGFEFTNHPEFAQIIMDEYGYISYLLTEDGKLKNSEIDTRVLKISSKIQIEAADNGGIVFKNTETDSIIFQVDGNGAVTLNDLNIISNQSEKYPISVSDINGNAGFFIDKFGVQGLTTRETFLKERGFLADINHIIMYGQSLSVGGGTGSGISLTPKFNSLMFSAGARTWLDQSANPEDVYAELIPLVERSSMETPCSGIAQQLSELIAAENGINPQDHDYQLLLSAPGTSDKSIAELSKGSIHYEHLLMDVQYGLLRAKELGKTYDVMAICWNQGEADATSNPNYAKDLVQLQKDLSEDISRILGYKKVIKLVMYQTASFNAYGTGQAVGRPLVAYSQIEAVTDPHKYNLYMSNTMYQYNYVADNVHLTPECSKLNGAAHGIALKRLVIDGADWMPIHVTKAKRQGTIIELQFHAPVLPLVLDDVFITNPGNYGFRFFYASGVEGVITQVSLTRHDTIRITVSQSVQAGDFITYAANGTFPNSGPIAGTRGCLRDSQSIVFDPAGLNKIMRNWCPIFKQIL